VEYHITPAVHHTSAAVNIPDVTD